MRKSLALFLFAALSSIASDVLAITIPTVPVGNPGNVADTTVMQDGTKGYGSVAYNYRIGTTEVTVGQYTAFLNAVAATDTYALYNTKMATNLNIAGIARSGSSGGYTYSVIGSANHPVTYVGWGDAARFANWLHNGQPTGAQSASTTEDGAYTLNGATENEVRHCQPSTPGRHICFLRKHSRHSSHGPRTQSSPLRSLHDGGSCRRPDGR